MHGMSASIFVLFCLILFHYFILHVIKEGDLESFHFGVVP